MFEQEKQKLKSLFDEEVCHILREANAVLAGGALTSIFTGKEINDLDIYFKTKEGFSHLIRSVYDANTGINIGMKGGRIAHYTDRSILINSYNQEIQLIGMTTYNSVWNIFDSFDFTINMCAYDFRTEEFIMHKDFLKHNAQRFLCFNEKTTFPLVSALRVDKYRERGYTISKAQMFRVLLACNQKKFESWDDFKKELGGLYGLEPDEVVDTSKEFSIEEGMKQLDKIFVPNMKFTPKANPDFEDIMEKFEHMLDPATKQWYGGLVEKYGKFYGYVPSHKRFDDSSFYLD